MPFQSPDPIVTGTLTSLHPFLLNPGPTYYPRCHNRSNYGSVDRIRGALTTSSAQSPLKSPPV